MSKPKYPWPLSLVTTPHVFSDGAELWPSGREQFSYLTRDKRRINFVVAAPVVEGSRRNEVITDSIRTFSDGSAVDAATKERAIAAVVEYFETKRQPYILRVAG